MEALPHGKRVTMAEIAAMAGVSKTIVSKIVNRVPGCHVSAEKRREIENIIADYNYVPLSSARSLATRRTGQIAFMLSNSTTMGIANQYYATILNGVYDCCAENDYQCALNIHNFSDIRTFLLPENLRRLSIDGCILSGFFADEVLQKLTSLQIPMVMIGRETPPSDAIPSIFSNLEAEYEFLLKYFITTGHRNIWIGKDWKVHKTIIGKLLDKYPDLKIKFLDRINLTDEFDYGTQYAKSFLALNPQERPTMLNASDHFSVAFLKTIEEHGLGCPRDISIVTGVETLLTRWGGTPLSSFAGSPFYHGRIGTELLLEMINGKIDWRQACAKATGISISLNGCFTDRNSVKNLRK